MATVANVDVTLAVGGVDQSVEVTAAAPLLDVQGTNLGKIIPKNAIKDLPLFISGGLRANLAFVVLTPGVIGASSNPASAEDCWTARANNWTAPNPTASGATTRL